MVASMGGRNPVVFFFMASHSTDRLDQLLDGLPPEGDPMRDMWEEWIADEMYNAGVRRHRGWTTRSIVSVKVMPGRESDARRWVEDLGKAWPARRLHPGLKRIIAQVVECGESFPPDDLFDVDFRWGIRRARSTTRLRPASTYGNLLRPA